MSPRCSAVRLGGRRLSVSGDGGAAFAGALWGGDGSFGRARGRRIFLRLDFRLLRTGRGGLATSESRRVYLVDIPDTFVASTPLCRGHVQLA